MGGIGAFFRVGFWGALPAELKGMEFVYRVPLMTHVSDFQNRVLKLIYPLVSDPAKVLLWLVVECLKYPSMMVGCCVLILLLRAWVGFV